ncbi:MAG: hypothetical protein ACTSPY_03975 [Candidatus Helarchaeota archaeon]
MIKTKFNLIDKIKEYNKFLNTNTINEIILDCKLSTIKIKILFEAIKSIEKLKFLNNSEGIEKCLNSIIKIKNNIMLIRKNIKKSESDTDPIKKGLSLNKINKINEINTDFKNIISELEFINSKQFEDIERWAKNKKKIFKSIKLNSDDIKSCDKYLNEINKVKDQLRNINPNPNYIKLLSKIIKNINEIIIKPENIITEKMENFEKQFTNPKHLETLFKTNSISLNDLTNQDFIDLKKSSLKDFLIITFK